MARAAAARAAAPAPAKPRTARAVTTAPAKPRTARAATAAPAKPRTAPKRAPSQPRRRSGPAAPPKDPATAPRKPASRTGAKPRGSASADTRKPATSEWLASAIAARGNLLLDRLLRGRLWVGCVGVLLAGIVFLNVGLLQLNDQIARTDKRSGAIGRENAALRIKLAKLDSTERIQRLAAQKGFVMPAPGAVRYVKSKPGDGRAAARGVTAPEPRTPVAAQAPAPQAIAPAPAAATPAATPAGAGAAAGTAAPQTTTPEAAAQAGTTPAAAVPPATAQQVP
jgi:hypothetical protein